MLTTSAKVYPPTTLTTTTNTNNQLSGTITGQTYGNFNLHYYLDVDNLYCSASENILHRLQEE